MRKRAPKAVEDYDAYFQINSSEHSEHMPHHETASSHNITVAPPQPRRVESSHIVRIPPPLPSPAIEEWSDYMGTTVDAPEELDIESKGENRRDKDDFREDIRYDDTHMQVVDDAKDSDETVVPCDVRDREVDIAQEEHEGSVDVIDASTSPTVLRSEIYLSDACAENEGVSGVDASLKQSSSADVEDAHMETRSDENRSTSIPVDDRIGTDEDSRDSEPSDSVLPESPSEHVEQEDLSLPHKRTEQSDDEKFYFSSRGLPDQFVKRSCSSDVDVPYDASFEEKE